MNPDHGSLHPSAFILHPFIRFLSTTTNPRTSRIRGFSFGHGGIDLPHSGHQYWLAMRLYPQWRQTFQGGGRLALRSA
jgi:hypothetical protein